jgi:hypothetical protein
VLLLTGGEFGNGTWLQIRTFSLTVTNDLLPVLAGQTANLSVNLYSLYGYNSNVNLSCAPATTNPPANCSVTPNPVSTTSGGSFTVNTGEPAGDYFFNVHAFGTDPAAVTHDAAVALHIVDFSLGTPPPASVSIIPGNTSAPVLLSVSALGSFSGTVTLSCSGLPSGASCQFQPSTSVAPTNGNSVLVTVSVTTSASTPIGTSQIRINAITA